MAGDLRVRVRLSVDASARVGLSLDPHPPSPAALLKRRRSQNRQLEALRDFLGKGSRDTAANRMWASREEHRCALRNQREGKRYGCRCKGVRVKGAPELWCGGCERFFHVGCERLDLSRGQLDKLRESYLCTECERRQLEAAGVDLLAPAASTVFECRHCERVFTTERGIRIHTARCAARPEEKAWSCLCKGSKSGAGGVQCSACTNYFHKKCRTEARPAWEAEGEGVDAGLDGLCEACARLRREEATGTTDLSGRRAARPIACAQQMVEGEGAGGGDAGGGGGACVSTAEFGTLANGRLCVRQSGLGLRAGLGLFAAAPFEPGEFITAYSGSLLFKAELHAAGRDVDQSYLLRIPGSGGQLVDGSRFAAALRQNPANPQPGTAEWTPLPGAPEWHLGAASMANDPRRAALYNARLVFKSPKGVPRDLQQLVPMRPFLCATQRIPQGAEILYNYGSDKPFHALPADEHHAARAAKRSRGREFRVKLVQPDAGARQRGAAGSAEAGEAAEREARRQLQLGARSQRASARTRGAAGAAGALTGGLLAAAMLQPDAPAPSCPVCGQCLQLSVAEHNEHVEECLRAKGSLGASAAALLPRPPSCGQL